MSTTSKRLKSLGRLRDRQHSRIPISLAGDLPTVPKPAPSPHVVDPIGTERVLRRRAEDCLTDEARQYLRVYRAAERSEGARNILNAMLGVARNGREVINVAAMSIETSPKPSRSDWTDVRGAFDQYWIFVCAADRIADERTAAPTLN